MGTLTALIDLLHDVDEKCRRYAAMALCNLATDPQIQIDIAKLGGMSPLIRVASDYGTEASRYASMAIGSCVNTRRTYFNSSLSSANLAVCRQNRAPLVNLGALTPLATMASSKNIECQRASSLAIYNLSCLAANHIPMMKADIVTSLSNLSRNDDLESKRYRFTLYRKE
jgi:hypothetical protein